jgi:hypothetical protein
MINLPGFSFKLESTVLDDIREAVKTHSNDADLGRIVRSMMNNVGILSNINPKIFDKNTAKNKKA